MNEVYEPSEDTYLLIDALRSLKRNVLKRVVEVGSGSGIVTVALAKLSDEVFAVDISYEAVKYTWRRISSSSHAGTSHVIQGDTLSMFRDTPIFDLIVSNPPYLPIEGLRDKTIEGGIDFIKQVVAHSKSKIKDKGLLVLVASTLTGSIDEILFYLRMEGFNPYIKLSRKLFFEEILIIEAVKDRRDREK
ncbi:MAG: methyltransferase [Nitrososphaerota archaeon]